MPLGHVVIGDMLPRISKAAQLSNRYTNYCVRATSIVLQKMQDLTTEWFVTSLAPRMSKAWTATVAQASGVSLTVLSVRRRDRKLFVGVNISVQLKMQL